MHAFKPESTGRAETAAYVRDMALELRRMVEAQRLDFLAYLLSMVADEAEMITWGPATIGTGQRGPRLVKDNTRD